MKRFFAGLFVICALVLSVPVAKATNTTMSFVLENTPAYIMTDVLHISQPSVALEVSDHCDPCPKGYIAIPAQLDYGVHADGFPWDEPCWIQYVLDCDERIVASLQESQTLAASVTLNALTVTAVNACWSFSWTTVNGCLRPVSSTSSASKATLKLDLL